MKIVSVETVEFEAALKTPFITALRRVDRLRDIVLILKTQSGFVGFGEGAPTPPITGETKESILGAIKYIKPMLMGKSANNLDCIFSAINSSLEANTTVKSMLSSALYDIYAKYKKVPLYKMLGGKKRELSTCLTISLKDESQMVRDAKLAIDEGYKILKLKIGSDAQKDAQKVLHIAKNIDSSIELILDANQGYNLHQSLSFLHTLESEGVVCRCIEQPVSACDVESMIEIKNRCKTPLLADEAVFGADDAKMLLQNNAADMINIKLAKSGGIDGAMSIADVCKEYGKKCMVGCMLEGPIAIATASHFASARDDVVELVDLDAVALLKNYNLKTQISFDKSKIILNDTQGIGIFVD